MPKRLLLIWGVISLNVLGLLLWAGFKLDSGSWFNFGAKPASDTFYMVTGQKPPTGVSQLRAAGRYRFTLGRVWLTLKVTPAVQAKIVAHAEPLTTSDGERLSRDLTNLPANRRFDSEDKAAVHWHKLAEVKSPRYFKLDNAYHRDSTVWQGFMVVDDKTGWVFIHSAGN